MKLSDREWKEFHITELFPQIQRGKRLTKVNQIKGNVPYVSSTALNNGVDNFISNDKKVKRFSNCLSIANSGSVGSSFYQPFEFVASDHVTHLKNESMNKYIYLFIATMTKRLSEKYNFNREINDTRISKERIILPVDDEGKPDYKFMVDYAKEHELNLKSDYLSYIENELDLLGDESIETFENKTWEEFFIGGDDGIFEISSTSSGIDKNKLVLENENSSNSKIPYITRTDGNNGINLFIPEEQKSKYKMDKENVITIGLDTQTVFYQPHKFYTGQNIQVLTNESLNKYNALFIIPLLKIQMDKFNWGGNGATLGRLNRTKIMLPVNDKGEPDYNYMEKYIKNSMRIKYTEYISFIELQNKLISAKVN